MEGAESCQYTIPLFIDILMACTHPKMMQASSARLLACSQVLRARSASTVPPYRPSGPVVDPVTQVFTTRLVLDSSTYGCPEEKALWRAFNNVVVETCEAACCIVFVRPPGAADEALE